MPTPIAPRIILSQNTRENLHTLIRAHSTPQALALRARLVLRAADFDRPTTLHISRELSCDNRTAGKWRRRYLDLGLSGLQEAIRAGRPKVSAPPTRVQVISVASALPQDQDRTVTRWTWAAIVATLLEALTTTPISRSSSWRILQEVELKPHQSAYWLNSHDEELERKAPTKPAQPGRHERRDHAYIRHGTRVLSNSLAVATGHMAWTIGSTRKAVDVGGPSQTGVPKLAPSEALCLGDGQPQHPLESRRLPLGGQMVQGAF